MLSISCIAKYMKYFSPSDYVTRNLFGQLGNKDYAITNLNPSLIIYKKKLLVT